MRNICQTASRSIAETFEALRERRSKQLSLSKNRLVVIREDVVRSEIRNNVHSQRSLKIVNGGVMDRAVYLRGT